MTISPLILVLLWGFVLMGHTAQAIDVDAKLCVSLGTCSPPPPGTQSTPDTPTPLPPLPTNSPPPISSPPSDAPTAELPSDFVTFPPVIAPSFAEVTESGAPVQFSLF
ncbi:hypothetical protein AMTR_s00033p00227040 [Amborella trichopoda]|uniref:Uncharacterized protein n=1 Tax=Amborella trichopoda TaxID=13333 RepID=U5CW57_AMBTC|nr:hypothetical protein AMTR_s00033p00227040 [Amborella trichopoda]